MAFNPIQTFLEEAEDLMAEIEQCGLALTGEGGSTETVHRLFRAFHTLKGSGGMCGLDDVASFTHHVEGLLDRVREGAIPVSDGLAELILKSADHVRALLAATQSGGAAPADEGAELIRAVGEFLKKPASAPAAPSARAAHEPARERDGAEREWRIEFHPNPALLANGGNPAALLRELRSLGSSCAVTIHMDGLPEIDAIEPDHCYLWWTIELRAAVDENAIRDVFIFVEDGSRLEIACVAEAAEVAPVPVAPAAPAGTGAAKAAPAAKDSVPAAHKPIAREATVRVPAERLDRLVNLVGELVMNHSCISQVAQQLGAEQLANPVQVLERLVAELRDDVLGIRMLPIGTLFGRFRRLVHDLSVELGKECDLVTEGAETELDKSILDQLGEPLVHCLRNSIDHGIETPADRAASGKGRATVRLSAAHTASNVVIRIEDDGRGINRAAVRAKAIERQLIAPDAVLSDRELLNLILLPGFSTAEKVTNVSGRGVGMDAVKRQIDALRGSLSVTSTPGQGTCVSITLPLTLAIIEGLLVEVGGERYIVPMSEVTENVELAAAEKSRHNGRTLLAVRGELAPYVDLRQLFEVGGEPPEIEKVVIVQHGDDRVGLVVDRVLGTHQTVLQTLGKLFRNVDVVSGATIMGDGGVALILDIAAIVGYADRQASAALAMAS